MDIVSLTTEDSFNSTAMENGITEAVDTAVSDGEIGGHNVSTTDAVEIGTPATGKAENAQGV